MAQLTEQQQRELDDAVREWQGRFAPRRGFPAGRKRAPFKSKAGFDVVAPSGVPAVGGVVPKAGTYFNIGVDTGAGLTTVSVSTRIGRPFMLLQVEAWGGGSDAARGNIGIKIAGDNSTAGGFNTSGTPLDEIGFSTTQFSAHGQLHRAEPHFEWREVPAFIKLMHFNNTAASVFVNVGFSLLWLD